MNIKLLFKELELLLSDIAFTGIHNLQPVTLQKLEDLKRWMHELSMMEGVHLINRFIESVYAYKDGRKKVSEVTSDLCALELYQKMITNNAN
ncbi:hypothetical protein [Bacteroides sp. 224]|uniref:hypothetical protein n=1 Tax=Bacteroides sp. 224 TaxID=2302936 RepID=UPI0013D274AC|nr:hypothetical protein [Bacteroides sp. 224]NDV67174.1 hypothetical protein [Bacteroides sp. 224]